MKLFVLTKPAERDLHQIKAYLSDGAGPTITRRVIRDIRNALELLGAEPGAGHPRDDLTEHTVKFWPIYSYLIVYDPESKPVEILRVLHGMRDIEAILK